MITNSFAQGNTPLVAAPPRFMGISVERLFSAEIGAEEHGRWLAEAEGAGPFSLYAHIPFCKRLCCFCGARTQAAGSAEEVARYADTMIEEISMVSARLGPGASLASIDWGGGTPTILGRDGMIRLALAIRSAFHQDEDGVFTVEVDANRFESDDARTLTEIGVTDVQDRGPGLLESGRRLDRPRVGLQSISPRRSKGCARSARRGSRWTL